MGTLTLLAVTWAGCSSSAHGPAASAPASSAASAAASSPTGQTTCGSGPSTGSTSATGPEVNPPGDIPDNQAYVVYPASVGGYSIQVPEGWSRTERGSAVTFTDKFNSVRIESTQAPVASTPVSAQAELPGLAANVACFQPGKVARVSRRAGPAVLVTYRADSAPDQVTGKVVHQDLERYEFWRAGTEVVVTLASPQGSDNVDPWRKITDSLTWTR
ncbi:MAG TPA: hypothetical protein VLL25_04625 [Acidimicrobiales bacterium]|nr:hypothetical protein [Acidimicrobiales bacterium]